MPGGGHSGITAIERLDDRTSRLISASLRITSLSDLSVRLLSNAVWEGGADRVRVVINLAEWRVECEDNGKGLQHATLESLRLADGMKSDHGERHIDQRALNQLLLQRQGTLCSAAALGAVEIWSRSPTPSETQSTILTMRSGQDAQLLSVPCRGAMAVSDNMLQTPQMNSSILTGRGSGVKTGFTTRVVVRDFFQGLPVRRQMAAAHRTGWDTKLGQRAWLEEIKQAICQHSLPMLNATIDVFEEDGSTFALDGRLARKRLLRIEKALSVYQRFSDLYQLRLSHDATVFDMGASSPADLIKGFVAVDANVTKPRTLLFINGRPFPEGITLEEWLAQKAFVEAYDPSVRRSRSTVSPSGHSTGLHDLMRSSVAHLLSTTGLLPTSTTVAGEYQLSKRRNRFPESSAAGKRLPLVIVLDISMPNAGPTRINQNFIIDQLAAHLRRSMGINLRESKSNAALVSEDRANRADKDRTAEGLQPTPPLVIGDRAVRPLDTHRKRRKRRKLGDVVLKAAAGDSPGEDECGPASLAHFQGTEGEQRIEGLALPSAEDTVEGNEGLIRWKDPVSHRWYLVDRRTGNSVKQDFLQHTPESVVRARSATHDQQELAKTRSILLSRRTAAGQSSRSDGTPTWLEATLSKWRNPVFGSDHVPARHRGTGKGEDKVEEADEDEERESLIANLSQNTNCASPSKRGWDTRRENAAVVPGVQLLSRFFQLEDDDDHAMKHRCSGAQGLVPLPGGKLPAADNRYGSTHRSTTKLPFSSADLKSARVIAQVDRKFVICSLLYQRASGFQGRIVICIDQHAADERIRVEQFFSQYFEACRTGESRAAAIKKPLPLVLRHVELAALLQDDGMGIAGEMLAFWGFSWTIAAEDMASAQEQEELMLSPVPSRSQQSRALLRSTITAIPSVVRDRLAGDANVAAAVFREVLQMDSQDARATVRWMRQQRQYEREQYMQTEGLSGPAERDACGGEEESADASCWLSLLRYLPPTLRGLIESKACRGAIMFNDSLTHSQCSRLVQQLSTARFPFQCAHGRPCVMPLFEVAGGGGRVQDVSAQTGQTVARGNRDTDVLEAAAEQMDMELRVHDQNSNGKGEARQEGSAVRTSIARRSIDWTRFASNC